MTQREAVIKTLERLGGIATLGTLYQEVFKITECIWKTKTPFASIRQIVQLAPEIYKIKPGLWALESHRKELESNGIFEQTEKNKESAEVKNFNHSYYQRLLLTMENLRGTIIGKNGSGKSSVMDLMYMAINNYAFLYINGFDNVIELKQNEEVKYQLRLGVSSNYSDSQRINIAEDFFLFYCFKLFIAIIQKL